MAEQSADAKDVKMPHGQEFPVAGRSPAGLAPATVPSRVLIVKLGAIGDVLMLLPAVYRLHQQGAQVEWVCGKVVAPLLAMYPWVERIEVDEQVLFHSGKAGQAKALLGLWQRLAGRSYDLCAVLQYDRRYSLLVKPVRARRKVKLGPANRMGLVEGRWHANEYARILGLGPDSYHENDVELLRPAEVPMTGPAEEIWANQERGKDESPLHHGWYSRVALVPAGAKNVLREGALRRWPLQNYVALAKSLLARGYEVVLTGSKEDAWVREAFGELLNSNATSTKSAVRDCIGRTTLPELLALYDACDAVVTHDTGSLHVAAISRAQVLAIFGPTAMGNFLPRRAGVRGIWGGERLPCRPCYDGRDFAPCPRNVCMEDVTVERVLHELEEMLGLKRE